jgi:hypothetical protein
MAALLQTSSSTDYKDSQEYIQQQSDWSKIDGESRILKKTAKYVKKRNQ